MNRLLQSLAGWLVMILLPPLLLFTSILSLLNPVFLNLEYRRPGFPADEFGFTLQDRLNYAKPSVAYLINQQNIEYLAKIRLPDGTDLFNERELSHMEDVKKVVQSALLGWLIGLVYIVLIAIWATRGHWMRMYWISLAKGGFLTIALLFIFLFSVLINFDVLFTAFHGLFFQSGSWVFYTSDSLIRLFPITFWQDCFTIVGVFTLIMGSLLGWQGIKRSRRLKTSQ
jgi:integral membrane protein (TIGR01906 family)